VIDISIEFESMLRHRDFNSLKVQIQFQMSDL
jgi:hypothetical protein